MTDRKLERLCLCVLCLMYFEVSECVFLCLVVLFCVFLFVFEFCFLSRPGSVGLGGCHYVFACCIFMLKTYQKTVCVCLCGLCSLNRDIREMERVCVYVCVCVCVCVHSRHIE